MNFEQIVSDLSSNIELNHIKDREVREQVLGLVRRYKPAKIRDSLMKLKLTLNSTELIHQPPRRLAPKEREAVQQQVDEWLAEGVIRPSS